MPARRPALHALHRSPRSGRLAGFSVLEIIVALVILLLLAGVVAPMVGKRIESARDSAAQQDMKTLAEGFLLYNEETHTWPHDSKVGPKKIPTGTAVFEKYFCLFQNEFGLPGWDGPYLNDGFKPIGASKTQAAGPQTGQGFYDPWGGRYAIHTAAIGTAYAPYGGIAILCAGKNGKAETAVASIFNGVAAGDDLVQVVTQRL